MATINEELAAMAKDAGIEENDVRRMEKHGLTASTAKRMKALGADMKSLWNLYSQYGDRLFPLMDSILSCIEAPLPAPSPDVKHEDIKAGVEVVDDEEPLPQRTPPPVPHKRR